MYYSTSDSDFDSPINRFSNSDDKNVRTIFPKIPRNWRSNKRNDQKDLEIKDLKESNKKNLNLNKQIPISDIIVSPPDQHSTDSTSPL